MLRYSVTEYSRGINDPPKLSSGILISDILIFGILIFGISKSGIPISGTLNGVKGGKLR